MKSRQFRENSYHALITFRLDCRRINLDLDVTDYLLRQGISEVARLRLLSALLPLLSTINRVDYLFSSLSYSGEMEAPCETRDSS